MSTQFSELFLTLEKHCPVSLARTSIVLNAYQRESKLCALAVDIAAVLSLTQ